MLAPARVIESLRELPAVEVIAPRVRAVLRAAFEQKRPELLNGEEVAELSLSGLPELSHEQAETPLGNILAVLDRGASTAQEWATLSALWAFAAKAEAEPVRKVQELAAEALWLSTSTPLTPLVFADYLLPADARELLFACVAHAASNPLTSASERVVLAATLPLLTSAEAARAAAELHEHTNDPLVQLILADVVASQRPLSGELSFARGRVKTTLLALSGVLFLVSAWRLFARVLLGSRHRASVTLAPEGITLVASTELLGKQLRKVERFLPFDQLVSIRRETRYANLALYAGLISLALGTYFGASLFTDGLRAPGGSPSLLAVGLLTILLGAILDLVLFRLSTWRTGAARVVIEPKKGKSVVLRGPDPKLADIWLHRATELRGRT